MLRTSICCFVVVSVASLCASSGNESPQVFEIMESPYVGMSYASLHELSDQLKNTKRERKHDWETAPIAMLGMLSVSRDAMAKLLQACDVITPCTLVCMASMGFTDIATIGAIICGLCQTQWGKKCVQRCRPLSFEDTKQGRILRIQLEEMHKEMGRCPATEKAAFSRSRPDLLDQIKEKRSARRSMTVSLSAKLSISVCDEEARTLSARRKLPPPSPKVKMD
jgi:hypothetical protein